MWYSYVGILKSVVWFDGGSIHETLAHKTSMEFYFNIECSKFLIARVLSSVPNPTNFG